MSSSARRAERRAEFEAEQAREERKHLQRLDDLWYLPEALRGPYIEMEDAIGEVGASKVWAFVDAALESKT